MGYRDAVLRCTLCDAELTDALRYAGVALCPRCHDGKNPRALLERGIHVQTVEENAVTNRGQRREYRYALGATSSLLPIQAGFDREGFLGRRFKTDLQTGDQLFDDAISIAGKGRELEQLLALEPVRLALMDLVAGGEIAVNDGEALARAHTLGVDELRRAVTLICWGMTTLAREASHPAAPPRTLPWSEGLSVHSQTGLEITGDRFDPRQLAGLPELGFLALRHLQLSSEDLTPLAWLPNLTSLRLIRIDEVRDLRPLGSMVGLGALVLAGCPVDDLTPLASLTGLRGLNLSHTRVRDLSPILELPLEELVVRETPIDDAQLDSLRQRRPGLRVTR